MLWFAGYGGVVFSRAAVATPQGTGERYLLEGRLHLPNGRGVHDNGQGKYVLMGRVTFLKF